MVRSQNTQKETHETETRRDSNAYFHTCGKFSGFVGGHHDYLFFSPRPHMERMMSVLYVHNEDIAEARRIRASYTDDYPRCKSCGGQIELLINPRWDPNGETHPLYWAHLGGPVIRHPIEVPDLNSREVF